MIRLSSRMLSVAVVCWAVSSTPVVAAAALSAPRRPPTVCLLGVAARNHWLGCLGGHPLVKTPHLDRLAARGTLFTNAHCQAPLCNPSRTSLLFGLRPTTTGVYGLSPPLREVAAFADRVSLPQCFIRRGYRTLSGGKIYHAGLGKRPGEMDAWGPNTGVGVRPAEKLVPPTPMGNNPLVDWGVFPHRDEDKGDYQLASWAVDQLRSMPDDRPFFLAAGFFLPHVPCYATSQWFDLYPENEGALLPPVRDDDRSDTPRFSWYLHWHLPEPRLKWVRQNDQWRNLVRSYLACVSFTDAQIGRVLTALEETGHADDTIVVVWGDHGWHLGEKLVTGKNTLWERSTRVPLIFAGPNVARGARCGRPAELLDIYPTLAELCDLAAPDDLEGLSLVPQLNDAAAPRSRPALTSHNQGNHAVRDERWRYIRYADGSEELYDHAADPHEWTNLLAERTSAERYAATVAALRKFLPGRDVPPAPRSASRVLTYDRATDEAVWEGKTVRRSDPIPE